MGYPEDAIEETIAEWLVTTGESIYAYAVIETIKPLRASAGFDHLLIKLYDDCQLEDYLDFMLDGLKSVIDP